MVTITIFLKHEENEINERHDLKNNFSILLYTHTQYLFRLTNFFQFSFSMMRNDHFGNNRKHLVNKRSDNNNHLILYGKHSI